MTLPLSRHFGEPKTLIRWLVCLAAFAPAVCLGVLVGKYSVDIGCWDMWENAALLEKWKSGTLRWSDLYAVQIQHRIVLPRLIVIALHSLSGGDSRWENYFTFGLSLLSSVLIYRLLRFTFAASPWVPALGFTANLLIFTPMLYQNVLWGSSLWMALPVPCLLLALAALNMRVRMWAKVAVASLLAEAATHSFAHGLCLWPVLATYVATQPLLGRLKQRVIAATVLATLGAATIGFYFHDFTNQAYHAYNLKPGDPALSGSIAHDPSKIFTVFLGFLGALYARSPWQLAHPMDRAPQIGAILLAVFVLCVVLILFTKTGRALWASALPWLALAAYVAGVGLMIGFGRAHTGEFRAVTPRYLTVSVLFWISTGVLVFQLIRALALKWHSERLHEKWLRLAVAAFVAAALAQVPAWIHGIHLMKVWHRARLQARALVLFIDHLPWQQGSATQNVVDRNQAYARDAIHRLQKIGLFRGQVLNSPDLRWFQKEKRPLPAEKGGVEAAVPLGSEGIEIRGHARFKVGHPADLVLVTLPEIPGGHRVVALGQPLATPALRLHAIDYEFANAEALPISFFHRWKAVVGPAALDSAETKLEFWALDVQSMRVARLLQPVMVRRAVNGTPLSVEILPE